jgi:FHS family L-fucose permease-like MFS transporter
MALMNSHSDLIEDNKSEKNIYLLPFILVTTLFFLWGLANSLNGTLVKQFQIALHLERWQANFVETAFYLGYFTIALPAGLIMRKYGYKVGIIMGLLLYAAGAFLFYPASNIREFSFFLIALYLIASGLAFLETAANLYVTVLGDPKKGEFRINLAQSFNGLSTILGPVIGGLFIFSQTEYTEDMLSQMSSDEAESIRIASAESVQGPYLFIGILVLIIAFLFFITKMPELKSKSNKDEKSIHFLSLLRNKHLSLGILAQFLNIGAQVSLWGNFIDIKLDIARKANFSIVNSIYRITDNMSDIQIASFHASFAFILFMVGRFVGTFLMNKFSPNKILGFFALGASFSVLLTIFSGGFTALFGLVIIYFFQSIMFPTIFALSCKNLGDGSKLASSLIIMSIVGGSVIPPITAALFKISTQAALMVPLICFIFIIYYGFSGSKLKEE